MNTEGLRRGDWVLIDGKIGQVETIAEGGINPFPRAFGGDFAYYDPEPIPLTKEILKKNGYVYNENREAWELIPNDGFGICEGLGREADSSDYIFCLGVFNPYKGDIVYHNFAEINYVHELQHLLKDIKHKKEIIC